MWLRQEHLVPSKIKLFGVSQLLLAGLLTLNIYWRPERTFMLYWSIFTVLEIKTDKSLLSILIHWKRPIRDSWMFT